MVNIEEVYWFFRNRDLLSRRISFTFKNKEQKFVEICLRQELNVTRFLSYLWTNVGLAEYAWNTKKIKIEKLLSNINENFVLKNQKVNILEPLVWAQISNLVLIDFSILNILPILTIEGFNYIELSLEPKSLESFLRQLSLNSKSKMIKYNVNAFVWDRFE